VSAALDSDGPAAPPRRNGELVFAEPWESRAFGLAVTLAESGALCWEDFRCALVERIAQAEHSGEPFSYYRCWLDALERTTVTQGMISRADLDHRGRELSRRGPGHDHA
jgi:nitrile hydratase accessory protein